MGREIILSSLVNSSAISTVRKLQTRTRILGFMWQPATNSFKFKVSLSASPGLTTKKSILFRIAQLFDPLGWLAPITIIDKIFMQQLWKTQVSWDDFLPPSFSQQWAIFDEELRDGLLDSAMDGLLFIIRHRASWVLGRIAKRTWSSQFADATVVHITAKNKVVPIKKQTIPRLEFSATILFARLLARVRQILGYTFLLISGLIQVSASPGSKEILPRRSFPIEEVCLQSSRIQDLVPTARWHHIAGTDNPADCVTRGLLPSQLRQHSFW